MRYLIKGLTLALLLGITNPANATLQGLAVEITGDDVIFAYDSDFTGQRQIAEQLVKTTESFFIRTVGNLVVGHQEKDRVWFCPPVSDKPNTDFPKASELIEMMRLEIKRDNSLEFKPFTLSLKRALGRAYPCPSNHR